MDEDRAMTGELRVLQELNPYEFGVSIVVMRSGPNRNKWDYQNLDKYYRTFAGTPILVAYTRGGRRVGDGHNMELRRDPKTGEAYYSFTSGDAERIVGTISDDPEDISLVERDGEQWIEAKGRIFRFYARELVDKIIEAGTMEVSAETEIHEEEVDEQGISKFLNWTALGITILGDGVAPAIPGARIAALQAMQEEFTELKLRAASLREGADPDAGKPEGKGETPPEAPAEDGGVKNNSDKGVNKRIMTAFNKTQIAALADKFTGWIVVCAAKDDEGKIHVAMRDESWNFARYVMNSESETFAPERVEKIAVNADFGDGMTYDVNELVDGLTGEVRANAALLESAIAERDAARADVETLRANEAARRVADCRRMASETLAAFNANRDERVEASVLDAVNTDIDNGLYANSADADGNWTGETEVAMRVKALCADAVTALDKARAEVNRRSFIWENQRNNAAHDDGSLRSMLDNYSID